MKERISWLDSIKGIGIFLVMLSHFCKIPFILITGYMPLFFFAAGITYQPSCSFKKTIVHKGQRLLIPWMFYGLFIFVVDRTYNIVSHTFTWHLFWQKLIGFIYMRPSFYWPYDNMIHGNLLSTNGPTWFLLTLFCSYMYLVCYERCKNRWVFIVWLVLLSFLTYKLPYQFPWGMELALIGTLILIVSASLRERIIVLSRSRGEILLLLLSASLVFYYIIATNNGYSNMIFRNYGNHGYLSVLLFFVEGLLYSVAVMILCMLVEKTTIMKCFAYLGKNSMRLLCIHYFIQGYTSALFLHTIPGFFEWPEIIPALFYIAEVIVANAFLNKVFKRNQEHFPILKWI